MDFLAFILHYNYLFIFWGMIFFGESVLLPALYLSFEGLLDPYILFAIALIAPLVSDCIWYGLAMRVPFHKVQHWKRIEGHKDKFGHLLHAFDKYHLWILFISKFVYGSRVLVQIICGAKKVHFWRYLAVNAVGTTAYLLLLYGIAFSVNKTVGARLIGEVKWAVVLFISIVLVINLCIKHFAQKKWLQ